MNKLYNFKDYKISEPHINHLENMIDYVNACHTENGLELFNNPTHWGEKFESISFLDIFDYYNKDKGITIETKFCYESDYCGHEALFAFKINENIYKISIGRFIGGESEFALRVLLPEGSSLKVDLVNFIPNRLTGLGFKFNNGNLELFENSDNDNLLGLVSLPILDIAVESLEFGIGLQDYNPYNYEALVKEPFGINGHLTIENIEINSEKSEKFSFPNNKIFVRFKINKVLPEREQIKVSFVTYGAMHERLTKGFISQNKYIPSHNSLFLDVDFKEIDEGVKVGEYTDWIDLGFAFSNPRIQYHLSFTFFADNHTYPLVHDFGNTDYLDVTMQFAYEMDEKTVSKIVNYDDTNFTIAFFVKSKLPSPKYWEATILTFKEYTTRTLDKLLDMGAEFFPKAKNSIVNGGFDHYYLNYPYCSKSFDNMMKIGELLGYNNEIIYFMPPEYINENPWAQDLYEKLENNLDYYQSSKNKFDFEDSDKPFFVKIGDEPHIIPVDSLQNSVEGQKQFEKFVRSQFYDFMSSDFEIPKDIKPVKMKDIQTQDHAILHFMTIWFLQIETWKIYDKIRNIYRNRYGNRPICGTDAYFAGFNVAPDYFVEAVMGATDVQSHHFGSGDTIGPREIGADRFIGDMLNSAAKYGNIRKGFLSFTNRIASAEGVLLSGITALARGLCNVHLYGADLRHTGWEWYLDDEFKCDAAAATSEIMRLAAKYDDFLTNGRQSQAEVAVVLSRSANIWADAPDDQLVGIYGHPEAKSAVFERNDEVEQLQPVNGYALERRMLLVAISRRYQAVDILPEEYLVEEKLKNYKVIYLTETHLSRKAQRNLTQWVRDGGLLFLSLGAAQYDEISGEYNLLSNALGIDVKSDKKDTEFSSVIRGMSGEIYSLSKCFNEEDVNIMSSLDKIYLKQGQTFDVKGQTEKIYLNNIDSEILATFEDKSPAIIKTKLGKGYIFKSAVYLGALFASTANPPFNAFRDVKAYPHDMIRSGRTAYYQQDMDNFITDLILEPIKNSNIDTKIKVNIDGLDSGLFLMDQSAVLFIGNYSNSAKNGLEISVELPFICNQVISEKLGNLDFEVKDNTIIIKPSIEIYDIITFN